MNLSDLTAPYGSRRARKRIGRGHGSGHEKTAGFGQKGQKSRSGHHKTARHKMGGQTPIQMQLPYKRGFKNPFRLPVHEVALDRLAGLEAGTAVTPEVLIAHGIIRDRTRPIVILASRDEELTLGALTVHAHRVSKGARAAIEAAGGSVELLHPADFESHIQPGRPGGQPAPRQERVRHTREEQ